VVAARLSRPKATRGGQKKKGIVSLLYGALRFENQRWMWPWPTILLGNR